MNISIEIIFYLICVVNCEKYIRFVNCKCKVNEDYLNLTVCNLKAISREKVLTNVDFYITKDVKNATLHLHFYKSTSTGRFNQFLFNHWGNVCEIVKEAPSMNFILKQTKRIMAKYSNAVRCDHPVLICIYLNFYFSIIVIFFRLDFIISEKWIFNIIL